MKADLIYQDETSRKFWSIEVNGNEHTVTYGRIGTDGTSKTKQFADPATAEKEALKLINAKKRKGYQEATSKASIIRDAYNFAGKPIKDFGSSFNPDTAVKVFALAYDAEESVVEKLSKLAKLSNIKDLDTMVIGSWEDAYDRTPDEIMEKLIELKDSFSGLKHFFVGDMDGEECEMSWINQGEYKDFYQHFPNLESFGVRGGEGLDLGKIDLPKLKNLVVESGGINASVIRDICDSDLPNLEYLDLWLGTDDYGCTVEVRDLTPILFGKFPKLKYLGLKNYHKQDELAKALKSAPVLKYIDILDLSMSILKDEGAEALYYNDDLLRLQHINCRHHFISDEWIAKLKTKFAAQNINLDDQEDSEDGEWYFVEIGE